MVEGKYPETCSLSKDEHVAAIAAGYKNNRSILNRAALATMLAAAGILLCSACSRVGYVPQEKRYEINGLYKSQENLVPTLYVQKDKRELGHLMITDPQDPTDKPYLIQLTKERSEYKASAPIFSGVGKRTDFSFSVTRGHDVKAGIEFKLDFNVPGF
ncbi:MAG: hypothetical protein K0R63_1530 [Rickettsiales bacterium]|jgi:hypothetical protein|nr:hypothetical protein [Rickettsiales bacterium]